MTDTRRVILDQREIRPDGTIQVRLDKQIVVDGEVIFREWHRTSFAPGSDITKQTAAVDTDLIARKYAAVDPSHWQKVHDLAAHEWTPEVVESHKKAIAESHARARMNTEGHTKAV